MPRDDKQLTTDGLKEVVVDASPAVTDYMLVIDPDTGQVTKVLLSVLKTLITST